MRYSPVSVYFWMKSAFRCGWCKKFGNPDFANFVPVRIGVLRSHPSRGRHFPGEHPPPGFVVMILQTVPKLRDQLGPPVGEAFEMCCFMVPFFFGYDWGNSFLQNKSMV